MCKGKQFITYREINDENSVLINSTKIASQ